MTSMNTFSFTALPIVIAILIAHAQPSLTSVTPTPPPGPSPHPTLASAGSHAKGPPIYNLEHTLAWVAPIPLPPWFHFELSDAAAQPNLNVLQ
jgi:hypothetical protein